MKFGAMKIDFEKCKSAAPGFCCLEEAWESAPAATGRPHRLAPSVAEPASPGPVAGIAEVHLLFPGIPWLSS